MLAQESAQLELTVAEAAKLKGVHDRTIRRWIREGILPAERLGPRLLRIKIADLDAVGKEVTPPKPDEIREAAIAAVTEARRLTPEHLDQIRDVLREA